ncbi:hypothetical protein ASPCAL00199 [Aspergillus calidoustus]|uniref:CST complex subunit Stn1 N-terminal domain-containing protein n=1 Tax=Aspergillus calidoustus TaxID=454130 RepID=A0A0U5C160_ASPCI|nr:hypothetical protein ASPCAL00199 [Aspergillus calidoustus]
MAPYVRPITTITSNSAKNNYHDAEQLTFYPAFCFKASPTHFAWVKLATSDIHRLRKRVEFADQGLFFYQNHPIRFANLIGIIIARTDVPRRTILTLDDSSGATIEVVVLKADEPSTSKSTAGIRGRTTNSNTTGEDDTLEEKGIRKEAHVTSTTHSPIDITPLRPGTLFQIKGTLSVFRSTMQVNLERFFPVPDTAAEMRFVEARCRFYLEVLSTPWFVSEGDIETLRLEADEEGEKIEEEQARARRRARRRVEREEKERLKIERAWDREEASREKDARRAREAGGELLRELEAKRKRGRDRMGS